LVRGLNTKMANSISLHKIEKIEISKTRKIKSDREYDVTTIRVKSKESKDMDITCFGREDTEINLKGELE